MRYAVSMALKRPAHNLRFSSDEPFEARSYFLVHLRPQDSVRPPLINGMNANGLSGLWFNEGSMLGERGLEVSIPNSKIPMFDLSIVHRLNETREVYESALMFVVFQWLLVPYVLLYLGRFRQFLFNRKRLARDDRIEVLRHIYLQTLKDKDYRTAATGLASEIYGYRWLLHPEERSIQNHYELVLNSLKKSGDLESSGYMFQLAPSALNTLATYEEEERRHSDNVWLQRAIVFLTFTLVVAEFLKLIQSS